MATGSITGLAGVLVWTEAVRFPAMARFYRDTLGLTPRSSKRRLHQLRLGRRAAERGGARPRPAAPARDPLRVMINLVVDDIRAVHARLARAGVAFTRAPEREDWGGWVATFADPDGNTLQLMQLPSSTAPVLTRRARR